MLTQLGPEKLCHGQGTWMGPEGLSLNPRLKNHISCLRHSCSNISGGKELTPSKQFVPSEVLSYTTIKLFPCHMNL